MTCAVFPGSTQTAIPLAQVIAAEAEDCTDDWGHHQRIVLRTANGIWPLETGNSSTSRGELADGINRWLAAGR